MILDCYSCSIYFWWHFLKKRNWLYFFIKLVTVICCLLSNLICFICTFFNKLVLVLFLSITLFINIIIFIDEFLLFLLFYWVIWNLNIICVNSFCFIQFIILCGFHYKYVLIYYYSNWALIFVLFVRNEKKNTEIFTIFIFFIIFIRHNNFINNN